MLPRSAVRPKSSTCVKPPSATLPWRMRNWRERLKPASFSRWLTPAKSGSASMSSAKLPALPPLPPACAAIRPSSTTVPPCDAARLSVPASPPLGWAARSSRLPASSRTSPPTADRPMRPASAYSATSKNCLAEPLTSMVAPRATTRLPPVAVMSMLPPRATARPSKAMLRPLRARRRPRLSCGSNDAASPCAEATTCKAPPVAIDCAAPPRPVSSGVFSVSGDAPVSMPPAPSPMIALRPASVTAPKPENVFWPAPSTSVAASSVKPPAPPAAGTPVPPPPLLTSAMLSPLIVTSPAPRPTNAPPSKVSDFRPAAPRSSEL
ncbi:hypothetical protein D3C87_948440 [compost metagenome]